MHASTDVRLIKCLDGLQFSFAALKYAYEPLYQLCIQLRSDSNVVGRVVWHAWSFVDVLHRIREIAQAVPGLSGKQPELRRFLQETEVVEQFRHYIQHLRNELAKPDLNPFPVWGSLAWADPNEELVSHVAVIGARVARTQYSSLILDMKTGNWVSRVSLSIADRSLNVDPLYEAAVRFRDFIEPWTFKTFTPAVTLTKEVSIMTVKAMLVPKNGA